MGCEVTTGQRPKHAQGLFDAWKRYWTDAQLFHNQLFAVFQGRGSWAELKKSFLHQQIANITGRNLDALKRALDHCGKGERGQEAAFCRALVRMLSGARVDWGELRKLLGECSVPPASD